MFVDEEDGLVHLPVSSPGADYHGGTRLDPIPLGTSVTALGGETGETVWSRQLVRHDIWDHDTVSAPTLVDIPGEGGTTPALVQPTKMGFAFVLNRLTGEPVFPIKDRPVPASDVEGERATPTQPVPRFPPRPRAMAGAGCSARPTSRPSAIARAGSRNCAMRAAMRRPACKGR